MRMLRPLLTAAVLVANAVLVTAVAAAVVEPASPDAESRAESPAASEPAETATVATALPPLGPVTTEKLPPLPPGHERDDEPAGARQLTQTITVTIQGGTLRVGDEHATITLAETGRGHFRGEFGPLTVIDGRGTLEGWEASVRVVDAPEAVQTRMRVRPDRPEVVHGERRGLRRASATVSDLGEWARVFTAVEGHGGGTYSSGGVIDVRAPGLAGQGAVEVAVEFSVA